LRRAALLRASAGPAAAARIGATRTAPLGVSDRNDNTPGTALLLDDGDNLDGPTARLGRRDGATARRRYGATAASATTEPPIDGGHGATERLGRPGRNSDGTTRTARLGRRDSDESDGATRTMRLEWSNSDGATRTARRGRRASDGATRTE
jgi:hypothetical protein